MNSLEGVTPNGTVVVARLTDGTEVNVTAGVQALYDLVIGSMDWGSGFWTVDDAQPVLEIARACGFKGYEAAESYVAEQRQSEEQARFLRERQVSRYSASQEHDHVWSSLGKCMWPPVSSTTQRASLRRKKARPPHRSETSGPSAQGPDAAIG